VVDGRWQKEPARSAACSRIELSGDFRLPRLGTVKIEEINKEAYAKALEKVARRFPSELAPVLPGGGILTDFTHEAALKHFLRDIVRRCDSSALSTKFEEGVAEIFSNENGFGAGVGMVNTNFEQQCRALAEAVDQLG